MIIYLSILSDVFVKKEVLNLQPNWVESTEGSFLPYGSAFPSYC